MADIDEAREIANRIKKGLELIDDHGDTIALADGFLALDEQVSWRYPDKGEMPKDRTEVEVIHRVNRARAIAIFAENKWTLHLRYECKTEDIECWRPLID